MTDFKTVQSIALALPGVRQSVSYGTPSFKVGDVFMGRLLEDGVSMSLRMDRDERAAWCKADPHAFSVPDHFKSYDYIVVHLPLASTTDMRALVQNAWRRAAPARVVKEFDATSSGE